MPCQLSIVLLVEKNDYRWEDVPVREYDEEFLDVIRQIMIGPDDASNNFNMLYFHLEPDSHRDFGKMPA